MLLFFLAIFEIFRARSVALSIPAGCWRYAQTSRADLVFHIMLSNEYQKGKDSLHIGKIRHIIAEKYNIRSNFWIEAESGRTSIFPYFSRKQEKEALKFCENEPLVLYVSSSNLIFPSVNDLNPKR